MKSKHTLKILLDIAMFVTYILLMFGYGVSSYFHEIMGIIIGFLFALHLSLNIKETKVAFKAFRNKKAGFEKKLKAISDLVLMISMPVAISTGIIISGVLFNMDFDQNIYATHYFASYLSLGIMLMHFALHMDYFSAVLLRSIRERNTASVKKGIKTFATIGAIVLTIYASANNYLNNINVPVLSDKATAESNQGNDEIQTSSEEIPTLSKYLSNLTCTACPKNCSLLAPKCSKGVAQAAAAEVDYHEEYEEEISTSSI